METARRVGEQARLLSAQQAMALTLRSHFEEKARALFPELRIEILTEEEAEQASLRTLSGLLQDAASSIEEKTLAFADGLAASALDFEDLHQQFEQLLLEVAWYKSALPTFKAAYAHYISCLKPVSDSFYIQFCSVPAYLRKLSERADYEKLIDGVAESMGQEDIDRFLHIAATPVTDERWRAEHVERPSPWRCSIRNYAIAVYEASRKASGQPPSMHLEPEIVYWP